MQCFHQSSTRLVATLALLVAAGPSFGQQDAAVDSDESAFGDNARSWVQLQVSGDAAEGPPEGFSAEIADRVWKRYAKSFDNEIPESFERESFSEGQ